MVVIITSFSNMENSQSDYVPLFSEDWDSQPHPMSPSDSPQYQYDLNLISESLPTFPELTEIPESTIDVPPKTYTKTARTARFDPFSKPQDSIKSYFLKVSEAKSLARNKHFTGYFVAPAKLLSHIRVDKRRDTDSFSVHYFPQ